MSFDAGGLAQMTYQSPFNTNSLGVSGPGFASRGKGSHIKRLSVAPPPKISTIDETQQANANSTPRTARGHLLAGLRTAPKSATIPNDNSVLNGLESSRYAPQQQSGRVPQTAQAAFFPNRGSIGGGYQNFSSPDQILAPPALDFGDNGIDQNLYDELVATNNYLAQQQRALQQQLLNVQAAAQQLGGINLNAQAVGAGQPLYSPVGSPLSAYNQQFQHGMQPIVQPVPGNPGVFAVYNPMTGQSSFVFDNGAPAQQDLASPRSANASPPAEQPVLRHQSPPSAVSASRSMSPPKQTTSPKEDVEPLPPPSANAFRRGHRKNLSSVNTKSAGDWTRGAGPKSANIVQTPMTGTFGPGQARAGEHPIRQPRNPPHLSELQDKPTSKHEGSKNFAARQRRRAVNDLVRAGRERLTDRQSTSDSGTPGSEADFNFSVSSEDNDVLARSGHLSSKPSSGSLAAIGSERKEKSRERSSVDSTGSCGAKSLSSDEGKAVGGNIVEVESNRRKTPLLVLSSAEKRKSTVL